MAIVWKVEDEAERVLRQRRAFRECLTAIADPASDVDAAELIYGELVANTVRYANGSVEAQLELVDNKPPVLVVRDRGPGLRCHPWTPRRDPYAESGRGLGIVELLARDVAVQDADGGGTVIRAVLPVTPRKAA
ncbi:MAG TPA: ATP-binding protein [Dongiaceae bacterium]|nr:ATP-binding protein [Dongiaceae bacterium]